MMSRKTWVRATLLAAVTSSLGLVAADRQTPTVELVQPAPRRLAATGRAVRALEPRLLALPLRTAQEGTPRDLFAAHSWREPPPAPSPQPAAAPVQPPPPPAPVAPPVPFTLLGVFETAQGDPVFYLAEGHELHTVGEGEVLKGVWRVGKASADGLELSYLPLSLSRTLPFPKPK